MLDVLVVDDDGNVLESVSEALVEAGHHVTEAHDGAEAADLLESHVFDLAICDVQMPKLGGLALLRRIRAEAPGTAVVLVTAYAQIADVVDSVHYGAIDYVTKPFDPHELVARVVAPIAERHAVAMEAEQARALDPPFTALAAVSPPMRKLLARIAVVASGEDPVLITGARGTGKELVARTLHAQSARRDGPFVLVDGVILADYLAAADPEEAGADSAMDGGWLVEALGGTLVLDGIEGLSVAAQAKLARLIAAPEHGVARSGRLGTRLITLARESLVDRVLHGRFLDALYYRLGGVLLHVPTLAERAGDLRPLVAQLLREMVPVGTTIPRIAPGAWEALARHRYSGNVRELRWVLEHALVMGEGGPIGAQHLPVEVLRPR